MTKEELLNLKEKLSGLQEEQELDRDLYLRNIANGTVLGPSTGIPSIDKPWLKYYTENQMSRKMPAMRVYDYLYECNKGNLNNIALSYYGKKITFRELFENIDRTARALIGLGVKPGDTVTISMPNTPEAVYLFYAISKIGVIGNMVDPRTSAEGIKNYVEEVKSDLIIIVDSYYDKVKDLVGKSSVSKVVCVSPSETLPLALNVAYKLKGKIDEIKDSDKKIHYNENVLNWKQFIKRGENINLQGVFYYQKNYPVVIEHTGGTTGKPKGVVLSNENINAVALQSVLTGIDMQRQHNWMDIMPTFIAYGVGMGLHLPLTIGMETILIPQFDPAKFDELILKNKPIHMVGVPSYWGTIINSKKLKNKDLSYMIAPTVGGDAMDKKLEVSANEYLKEHGCSSKIVKGYGMTEVTGGVAGTVDANNEVGSVGIPFVKSAISIFEPQTENELMYEELGEVCISSPNMMIGYFNNEKATEEIIWTHADGKKWVHTGDLGYMTKDGNIFIVDRIKRMLIRYDGFKIFPSIIEDVIISHPAVEACKVVGIPDVDHSQGKLPKAHIVLKEKYKYAEKDIYQELQNLCYSKLPEYCLPADYEFHDELPVTSIGKIDYRKLEQEDLEKIKNDKKLVLKKD